MILNSVSQRIRRKTLSELTNAEKGKLYNSLNRMIANTVPGKYVKYISALVCTILVISPLSSVLKKVSVSVERPSEAVISEDSLTNAAISITEKQLTEKISEKFGITPTGIRIEIDRDGKISLSLSLTEEDEEHRERIEEYLDSLCR